ncbi:hypothetical protein FRB99_005185 [Tulasnella sp. 403]|nr:hypothetical protein FRB99_005185 [Tulasnella sp. 403]
MLTLVVVAVDVAEALGASLNPDASTRIAAELRLSELMTTGECGVALATILISPSYDLSLRQISTLDASFRDKAIRKTYFPSLRHSAGTILQRKYVLEHWSPVFGSFKGNAPSPHLKSSIRDALLRGLSDPARKIRTASGYALSTIAQSDWPDECPDLLTSLITLLSSGSPDPVDGAMRVFAELTKSELSEEQLLPVLRQLLPVLLKILGSPEHHSPLTRARVLGVFNGALEMLFMVKEQHKGAVKEATEDILPSWLTALKVLLDIDPRTDVASEESWDGLAVRLQIFKILERITYCFPRAISSVLPAFFASALSHLDQLFPTYRTHYIAETATPPGTTEDPAETNLLSRLGGAIMEFAKVASRTKVIKSWLLQDGKEVLASFLVGVVAWAPMTNDDEEQWATDANAFVADADDEDAWTIRATGFDLISSFMESNPAQTARALQSVMERTIVDSDQARTSGQADWWKPLEAALAAVGSSAEALLDCNDDEELQNRSPPFNVQPVLTNVIPPILGLGDYPFIQGRAFVFASQFYKLLPQSLFSQYFMTAVEVLESPTVTMPVKISAVKAIRNFSLQSDAHQAILPLAARIGNDLLPFLPETSESALALVIEALLAVIDLDGSKWLTPDLTVTLARALIDVWIKNVKDPILLSVLNDIFIAVAKSPVPGVYQAIVTTTLPLLADAVSRASASEAWVSSSAIDLATSLMRGVPKGQLGEGFFALLGPALFACLTATEDRDVIQNGIECLTLVIRKGCDQLLSFVSPVTGETGVTLTLKLVATLLTPATSETEAGGLFIGDMIVHLLKNAGSSDQLRPHLPELLTALVRRLQTAKTATYMQSLIIPFAYLIHSQRDEVLNLLESTQVGSTTTLEILVKAWCENAETFHGFWATRMSTIALCDLFASDRASLRSIMVRGDMIVRPETKNAPTEYTSIPFHVKALKLLVDEFQQSGEDAVAGKRGGGDAAVGGTADLEGTDDGDEWAEEEDLFQGLKDEELGFLSEYIAEGIAGDNLGEQGDDEDLKADPVSQINLGAHLMTFFRQSAQTNVNDFSRIVDELNVEEILVLRRIVGSQ